MNEPVRGRHTELDPDPVWVSGRREAWAILLLWLGTFLWTIGFSWFAAYRPAPVALTLGLPSWVFWGILVPWVVAGAISVLYSLCVMTDEDLNAGAEPPSRDANG